MTDRRADAEPLDQKRAELEERGEMPLAAELLMECVYLCMCVCVMGEGGGFRSFCSAEDGVGWGWRRRGGGEVLPGARALSAFLPQYLWISARAAALRSVHKR